MKHFLKKYLGVVGLIVSLLLLYVQIIRVDHIVLGWISFGSYIWCGALVWQQIYARIYGIKRKTILSRAVSIFSVIALLSLIQSIWVVWYTASDIISLSTYGIVAVISVALSLIVRKKQHIRKDEDTRVYLNKKTFFKLPCWTLFIYLIGWFGFLMLLQDEQSSAILMSPWQAISEYILPLYFILTVLLGIFLFSRFKTKTLLILIVLHSFLVHAYLPLSHILPWGGDVWRTIAVEETLADDEFVLPVIAGPEAKYRDVFGIAVPEALLIPHKYVYGQLWGASVLADHTLGLDLLTIHRWMMPILWSFFLPLLLYRIGRLLFHNVRYSLWFSAASLLPFTFQVLGGITLAVSLGTLMFIFALMLLLQYLRDKNKVQLGILLGWTALMVFSYTLHFILLVMLLIVSLVLGQARRLFRSVRHRKEVVAWKWIFGVLGAVICIAMLPLLEEFAHISTVTFSQYGSTLKQFVAAASGWFFATEIRGHDIIFWNVLFNHTPTYSHVASVFTTFRWHVFIMSIVVLILSAISTFKIIVKEKDIRWQVIGFLSAIVVGGYTIGWVFAVGDRSFVRRLDSLMALLLLLGSFYALASLQTKQWYRQRSKALIRGTAIATILLLSWVGTSTYASGPDMRVLSSDEYGAAGYIWQESHAQEPYCVIADTWPLLALESISQGAIVGGGFPIDYQFGQQERVEIYTALTTSDSLAEPLARAHTITQAQHCLLLLSNGQYDDGRRERLTEYLGEPVELGAMTIWTSSLNSDPI